jgi:EAL domain-containing protein (putative c-di-GMP-specific phosphodiesterase class I)
VTETDGWPAHEHTAALPPDLGDRLGEAEQVTDAILLSLLDAPWLLSCHHRPVVRLHDRVPVGDQAVLRIGYGLVAGRPDDLLAAAARQDRLGEALELTRQLAFEEAVDPDPTRLLFLPAGLEVRASRAGQQRLLRGLDAAGLAPDSVVLEVDQHADLRQHLHGSRPSETVDLTGGAPAGQQLAIGAERLRDAGVRLAAGDAGAGWAALDLLSALAPEVIVLGAELVARLPAPAAASAVRSLVELAAETRARTVADGVDTPEKAVVLAALGVDWARGPAIGATAPPR